MLPFSLLYPPLYCLVPFVLGLYWYFLSEDARPVMITMLSGMLLLVTAPLFFIYVVLVALLVPYAANRISRVKLRIWAYGLGLLTILFWKYILGFYTETASSISDFDSLFAVIGVSYMGLRITSLLIHVHAPNAPKPTFLECLNFLSFFPTIAAGPLENMAGFKQGYTGRFDRQLFWDSIYRIAFGLFKKLVVLQVFFDSQFGATLDEFTSESGAAAGSYGSGTVFLLCTLLFLNALLDISAYTDLARGFAGLFGYRIIRDINYPLAVKDLSHFWRSWHISVMRWCQTHIYFPVFLHRRSIVLGTFASLLVMGLWHSIEMKWLVWGLYQAIGLTVLHKWNRWKASMDYPPTPFLRRAHCVSGCLLTFVFATFAFLIIGPESFARSVDLMEAFVGMR